MLPTVTVAHLLIVAIILLAGAVSGVAGFGFAVVGTMLLATLIDPATAVVFMIVPVFATNAALARELSSEQLRSCGTRFAPLVLATVVGTIVGMIALREIPQAPLTIGLGVLSLGFVATVQRRVSVPGLGVAKSTCFVESVPAMVGIGAVGGAIFGGTNVGVQLIAYLRSVDLSHSLFVGVVAMVFLGVNGVRVGAAAALGLYPDQWLFVLSLAAVIPAVAGVAVGKRVRNAVSEAQRRGLVLSLLTIIGVRLLLGGFGVL